MALVTVLHSKLAAAGIPVEGVADNGDGTYRVDFAAGATPAQQSTAAGIVSAFNTTVEQAGLDALEVKKAEGVDFTGLPDWAAYTTAEAVDAIHNAILAGDTLAQAQAKVDALPFTAVGMRAGLKSAAAEMVTIRGILEKMAIAIVHLRNRTS